MIPEPSSSHLRMAGVLERVRSTRVVEKRGRVVQMIGLVIESEGPLCAVGEICRIESARHDGHTLAEVVGFRAGRVLLMPLGDLQGIHPGSEVIAHGRPLEIPVGDELLGRVLNSLGEPMDAMEAIRPSGVARCMGVPPHPLRRARIHKVFSTGIKAIDTLIPVGRGQRLGIFAGSGVGKSTLLGMMAAHSEADINVIALVGERGREVREFLEKDLTEEGRRKSVVVVATSNEPALCRLKGAYTAMAIAEYFRDQGRSVLLMMDSVTRFAMAQREIGLAVGEPPATRGYTPSVFALLPQLLERAGAGEIGSITAFFTVLVEGDDMNEPVADTVRGILDGHIVLDRNLAQQNHYPAIDILQSISRLTRDLCGNEQLEIAGKARELMAIYRKNADIISLGAYVAGSNHEIDTAIRLHDSINSFLRQGTQSGYSAGTSWEALNAVLKGRKG